MDIKQFTRNDNFLMLAFDHRGSFKKLINHDDPDSVSNDQAIQLKRDIIQSVDDQFTSVLIDQEIGLKAYVNRTKPFLLPIEDTGYTDKLGERITEIKYSVEDLIRDGAAGVKILLYFNPDVPSAKVQLHTARRVLAECKAKNVPLFLEIRVYKQDTGDELGNDLEDLVLRSVQTFLDAKIYPHIWKLEYPGSFEACQKITQMVGSTPWILLTKGASFEDFVEQLRLAKQSGCQGFLAGRAVWQEVCSMTGEDQGKFLKETLPARFKTICSIFD